MIPVLLALGATGAVLELRRLVQRGPEGPADVQVLRQNELRLHRALQELERELQHGRQDLAHEREAAERLAAAQAELTQATQALQQEKAALESSHQQLQGRSQQLQQEKAQLAGERAEAARQAELLQGENADLSSQVEQLQAAHAQAMQALKDKLCILLEGFSSGELSPDTLLQELQLLGIDAQLPLPALAGSEPAQPEAAEAAGAEDVTPRERLLTDKWTQQLQLMSQDPEKLTRLLTSNALRAASNSHHRISGPSPLGLPPASARGATSEPRMLPYNVSTIANSGLTPRQLFNIDTIKAQHGSEAPAAAATQLLAASTQPDRAPAEAASAQPAAAAKPTLKPLQLRQEGTASPTKGSLQFAAAKGAQKSATPRLGLDVVFGKPRASSPSRVPSAGPSAQAKAPRVPALALPKSSSGNALLGSGQELSAK